MLDQSWAPALLPGQGLNKWVEEKEVVMAHLKEFNVNGMISATYKKSRNSEELLDERQIAPVKKLNTNGFSRLSELLQPPRDGVSQGLR